MKRLNPITSPSIALAAALAVTAVVTALLSDEPGRAITYLAAGPVMSSLAFGNVLESAAKLTIAGLAAALAFRAGSFNLGGEGQALTGGITAAALALAFPSLPRQIAPFIAVLVGITAGAALGALSGGLRARWGVDELISTFLISAAVLPVGQVLLGGPMKDVGSYLIAAPPLPAGYRIAAWWPPSRLGVPVVWAIAAASGATVFLKSTHKGYEWRLKGANEVFARYGGIHTGRIAVLSMAASGGLYGLAGTAALLDGGQAVQGFTSGLGWDGLAVALIAGSRPELIVPAALAYAWLIHGTRAAMMHTGFSFALSGIVQAVIFLFVTTRLLTGRRRSA
jgi:ABC-type uncharacterized transport system permease subunit